MSQIELADAEASHEALRAHINRTTVQLFGHAGEIAALRREPAKASTSYDTEIVTVKLSSGEQRRLFLKNYGIFICRKDDMEQRREREISVYRELLSDADVGTPEYYGCIRDAARGQFWMLLEFISGTPAGYLGTENWIKAAGWIGRMHKHFAGESEQLSGCEFLIRHDAAHFLNAAAEARESVARICPESLDHFQPVADQYEPIAEVMARDPFTLVHGASRPVNMMICDGEGSSGERRRPRGTVLGYDWEEAAFGSPMYDLAYLADGFEPPVLDQFFAAYREATGDAFPSTSNERLMKHTYECFRVHLITHSLAQARVREYGATVIHKLVSLGRERFESVLRGSKGG